MEKNKAETPETREALRNRRKGGARRWLAANALPLVSMGLMATAAITTCMAIVGHDSAPNVLFKQAVVGNERLSLDERIVAWKYALGKGGGCGNRNDYERVIGEMQDEQFRLMRLGDEAGGKKISRTIESFMSIEMTARENRGCARDSGK